MGLQAHVYEGDALMMPLVYRSEDEADRKALARAREQVARLETFLGAVKVNQVSSCVGVILRKARVLAAGLLSMDELNLVL
jgi:hypothetical protein